MSTSDETGNAAGAKSSVLIGLPSPVRVSHGSSLALRTDVPMSLCSNVTRQVMRRRELAIMRRAPSKIDGGQRNAIRSKVFSLRALLHEPDDSRLLALVPAFRKWCRQHAAWLGLHYTTQEATIEYMTLLHDTVTFNRLERCWYLAAADRPSSNAVARLPGLTDLHQLAATCKRMGEMSTERDKSFGLACRSVATILGYLGEAGEPHPAKGRGAIRALLAARILHPCLPGKPGGRGKVATATFRYTGD